MKRTYTKWELIEGGWMKIISSRVIHGSIFLMLWWRCIMLHHNSISLWITTETSVLVLLVFKPNAMPHFIVSCTLDSLSVKGNWGEPNYPMQRRGCTLYLSFHLSLLLPFSLHPSIQFIELVTLMTPLTPTHQNNTRTGKSTVQFSPTCGD